MITDFPHSQYLLLAEATARPASQRSLWRFALERVDGGRRLRAFDYEDGARLERLELLAVVRGLEALDEPARVTLVTKSRYVSRGLRIGLNEWRTNDWQWERFGQLTPIRDHDLWRRVDHALQFHRVTCRRLRFDGSTGAARRSAVHSGAPRTNPRRRRTPASAGAEAKGSPVLSSC